jgi:hypothetical protein
VLVAALVVAGVVMLRGGTTSAVATGSTTTMLPSTTTPRPTTTTIDPVAVAQLQAAALEREGMLKLENILTQSASGRAQIVQLVAGVQNCTIDPDTAAKQVDAVVFNRQTVLTQVVALNSNNDTTVASLSTQLQRALQASIDADRHYSDWMKYLYATYYYTYPVGCPFGRPPTNGDFDAGQASSGDASAAKAVFVAAYNPVATGLGLRTWSATEI